MPAEDGLGAWNERNKMGFSFLFFKCKDDFEKSRVAA
jgi:hypothetical protein